MKFGPVEYVKETLSRVGYVCEMNFDPFARLHIFSGKIAMKYRYLPGRDFDRFRYLIEKYKILTCKTKKNKIFGHDWITSALSSQLSTAK